MSRSDLVVHLARFAGALRERDVAVSLSDEADGLEALTLCDLGDREEVRLALRTALKIRPRDAAAFEELFAKLWRTDEEPEKRRSAAKRMQPPSLAGPGAVPAGLAEGRTPRLPVHCRVKAQW